jgi:hypothetical protein
MKNKNKKNIVENVVERSGAAMYMRVCGIYVFVSFSDNSIGFWKCSDSVGFFIVSE